MKEGQYSFRSFFATFIFMDFYKYVNDYFDGLTKKKPSDVYEKTIEKRFFIKEPTTIPEADLTEFVYLFQAKNSFKIGMSSNPEKRIIGVGYSIKTDLRLIHTIKVKNARSCEAYFHRIFATYRLQGEWFSLPQDAVEWFCSIQAENDLCLIENRKRTFN